MGNGGQKQVSHATFREQDTVRIPCDADGPGRTRWWKQTFMDSLADSVKAPRAFSRNRADEQSHGTDIDTRSFSEVKLQNLLSTGAPVNWNEHPSSSRSPLPSAAHAGNFDTVNVLSDTGPNNKPSSTDLLGAHGSYSSSPLLLAAAGDCKRLVKKLIVACDGSWLRDDDMTVKDHTRWTGGHARKLTKAAILTMMLPPLRVLHKYGTSHESSTTTLNGLSLPDPMVRLRATPLWFNTTANSSQSLKLHEPAWFTHPDPLLLLLASMTEASLMASYHQLNLDDGAQDIIIGISLVTSIAAGLLAGHSMAFTALTVVPSALSASLLVSDAFHTGLKLRQRSAVRSWGNERQSAADGLAKNSLQEKFEDPGKEVSHCRSASSECNAYSASQQDGRDSKDLEAQNG